MRGVPRVCVRSQSFIVRSKEPDASSRALDLRVKFRRGEHQEWRSAPPGKTTDII